MKVSTYNNKVAIGPVEVTPDKAREFAHRIIQAADTVERTLDIDALPMGTVVRDADDHSRLWQVGPAGVGKVLWSLHGDGPGGTGRWIQARHLHGVRLEEVTTATGNSILKGVR